MTADIDEIVRNLEAAAKDMTRDGAGKWDWRNFHIWATPLNILALIADWRRKTEALEECMAELIYLRLYGKDGARWEANDHKDVWRAKARAALGERK